VLICTAADGVVSAALVCGTVGFVGGWVGGCVGGCVGTFDDISGVLDDALGWMLIDELIVIDPEMLSP